MSNVDFMAFNRNDFKNKFIEKIIGAMREYGKCTLAGKNNVRKWRGHWCGEYLRLIGPELLEVFDFEKKGSFDRNKVFNEALKYCKTRIPNIINTCNHIVSNDYEIKLKNKLTESDFDHLFELINKKGSIPMNEYSKEYRYQNINEEDIPNCFK